MKDSKIIKPFVSVIIPNYNHSEFLSERIESVLNQTYQNFEIIILDDFSNDSSKEIIEKYRFNGKVSHIIYNIANSGSAFSQWFKGINLSIGEWIWIAESDDVAESVFLETLIKSSTVNSSLIYCKSLLIDRNGKDFFSNGNNCFPLIHTNLHLNGKSFILEYLSFVNSIPNASAVVFKKQNVDFNVFDIINKTKLVGDWIFWISLLQRGDVVYLDDVLNKFRFHDLTVRKSHENIYSILLEYVCVFKYLKSISVSNSTLLDKMMFMYLYSHNKNIKIKFISNLRINYFFLTSNPKLYVKSVFKSLF